MRSPIDRIKIRRDHPSHALVIAVIALPLATLLGILSLRGAVLQGREAEHLQDQALAFQAAEAALRAGEAWLQTAANRVTADHGRPLLDPASWSGTNPNGRVVSPGRPDSAAESAFHVGPSRKARIGIEIPPTYRHIYPVTARAGEAGGDSSAVVILQSTMAFPE